MVLIEQTYKRRHYDTKERILAYMRAHPGKVVTTDEMQIMLGDEYGSGAASACLSNMVRREPELGVRHVGGRTKQYVYNACHEYALVPTAIPEPEPAPIVDEQPLPKGVVMWDETLVLMERSAYDERERKLDAISEFAKDLIKK